MSLLQSITQKTIEDWMEESHPLIDSTCCFNTKQRKFVCTECQDICPQGVYDFTEPNWDICENCNLCVVACPSQAICPSSTVLAGFLRLLEIEKDVITVSCKLSDTPADLQVSCLAAIPWEMLARIAFEKTLVLDTTHCDTCDRSAEKDQIASVLTRAKTFLGEDYFNERIRLDAKGAETVGVSRREAFSAFRKIGKKTIANLLPGEKLDKPADGALYRKILVAYLLKKQEEGTDFVATWETPVFSEDCIACSICSKICIHGALEVLEDGEIEGVRHIIHTGSSCVHCGLCETLCPKLAIEVWDTYSSDDPLETTETPITVKTEPSDPEKQTSFLDALKKIH